MKRYWAVVVILCIVMAYIVFAIAPARATNQSGTAITACDAYGGGVKLFSGDGQTGPDRVLCPDSDGVVVDGSFETYPSNTIFDVGLFDNNTDSLNIRAIAGCQVHLWLYPGLGRTGTPTLYQSNNLQGSSPKVRSLDTPDNVFSSGDISAECN